MKGWAFFKNTERYSHQWGDLYINPDEVCAVQKQTGGKLTDIFAGGGQSFCINLPTAEVFSRLEAARQERGEQTP